ncbi:MAG: S41 family peptidase, partial [Candidatus Hodarchaeales archaeon]
HPHILCMSIHTYLKEYMDPDSHKDEDILRTGKRQNFGFKQVKILDGNVGYIELNKFSHTKIREAAEVAISAMQFIKHTDAVIIDLRNNGGGEPEMVQLLASYFFDVRTQLNTIEKRYEMKEEQWWTYPYVPGKAHSEKDLYILTSSITFSGAEDFTYALQCQKRALVVGEQTKGGGHSVDFFPIHDDLVLMLPTGRAFNTLTKDGWEGKGITPDIKVSSDKAFNVAYTIALEKLKDSKLLTELEKLIIKIVLNEITQKKEKISLDSSLYRKYIGKYGRGRIELINNELHYITENSRDIKLFPIGEDLFQPEGKPDERIYFELDPITNEFKRHWYYSKEQEIFTTIKN